MFYNTQLFDVLESIQKNFEVLNDNLSNCSNTKEIIALNKEIAKHKDVVANFVIYKKKIQAFNECIEIAQTEKNNEFVKLAYEEAETLKKEVLQIEEKIQILLLPKDPNDNKNVIIEMHPAAGGNEASIFVANLFEAYKKYADLNHWKLNIADLQENNFGIASLTFTLSGKNVYSKMKFESGVHRVQRIPSTESKGRVHTSTITVSVFPEQDEIEVNIDPSELRIDVFRASGAGGQHVNKTESAVRVIHLPTGILVACQQERSQLSNKEQAMKILKAKLWELKSKEQTDAISSIVKEQVGRGMRAEKIRTYNYPQNRITDHRISLTINNLDICMLGNFTLIHEGMISNEVSENLKKLIS